MLVVLFSIVLSVFGGGIITAPEPGGGGNSGGNLPVSMENP